MTGSAAQLRALLALRWQMVRTPGVRLAIALAAVFVLYLLELALTSTSRLSLPALQTAVRLGPAAFLGFGVLAVVAPLTAGGGSQVFPADQLVAFPVRSTTSFLAGLVLAPVNLVWAAQLVVLAAETAYLCAGHSPLLGLATTALYVAALTSAGQALAWLVVGLRQDAGGRRTVRLTSLGIVLLAVAVVRTRTGPVLIRDSPTRLVVHGVVAGGEGDYARWATTTGALVAVTVAAWLAGARLCGWALRRPSDAAVVGQTRPVRRRTGHRGPLAELVRVDRASVWRAPALRRGGLVLAVLPSFASVGGAIPWKSVIVLPGLVAAGAGLLFGVNAFCLDGSGAVWLASLPHPPSLVARAKTIVLAETVGAAVLLSAVTASLRSPGRPTATELTAIVSSGLTCTLLVVATGLSLSVRRPHRAELKGPRDAVAPPGALAFASLRLALPAGAAGALLETAATSGRPWLPPLLAAPIAAAALVLLLRNLARYDDPLRRSRIVATVAAG